MDFLKKHYEKILLSIVLLGLAGAAAALPFKVSRERQFLEETVTGFVRTKPKEFPVIDLSTNRQVLVRLNSQMDLTFSGPHNLFNPVPWKKSPEGRWYKLQTGNEVGPGALRVTSIQPLYLMVTFEGESGTPENPRYHIGVEKQTDQRRGKNTRIATLGVRNDLFVLLDARPAQNPVEFDVQLADDKQIITLKRDAPYQRVIGYAADLRYPPSDRLFRNQRVGDVIRLPDMAETYKIVAIDQHEVVLSASSTQKRTTITYDAATASR